LFGVLKAAKSRSLKCARRMVWQARELKTTARTENAETSGLWFWPIKNDHRIWKQVAKFNLYLLIFITNRAFIYFLDPKIQTGLV
jgi:hypothetical protein